MVENNQLEREYKPITSLYELKNVIFRIKKLEREFEFIGSNNTVENKYKKMTLTEEMHTLILTLQRGISFDINTEKNHIIEMISSFLEPFGYSKKMIENALEEIAFFTSDIRMAFSGMLVCFANHIGIDYNFIDFDENGKVLGLDSKKKEFLMYTLTHEFLHKCSVFSSYNTTNMTQDAFSEGFTDMFAQRITNYKGDTSKRYDFSVKVCSIFTELLGTEKVLYDYMEHIYELPNLNSLFIECGLTETDFKWFYGCFNEALNLRCTKPSSIDEINNKEIECLDFLKTKILFPYCLDNPEKKQYVLHMFDIFFPQHIALNTSATKKH